ncbi:MAG TPA: hypothetical protein VMV94_19050 [Phycisphaerae bacterium]|nr:hypothetical protein [Phycisphaerae bacterium]
MKRPIGLVVVSTVCFACGCGPTIKTITPTGKKMLESVLIEGTGPNGALEGLDHAVVLVDGGPVGSPLFTYPKSEIFIPVARANGQTTGAKVQFMARNSAGDGNMFEYSSANVPVNAPAVSIDQITQPFRMAFSNEITMTVFGDGMFPGAGNAGLGSPHAGPPVVQAVPVSGGVAVTATKAVFMTDNSIQVFFPDTLPRGVYQIYLKNDPRYGGVSGTSQVTFEWK